MPDNDTEALRSLTDKQREVLDLLLAHKTSKEIARELGISPHTVDQRVQFAKEKLNANSRGDAAVEYRRLLEVCQSSGAEAPQMSERLTYGESRGVGNTNFGDFNGRRDDEETDLLGPFDGGSPDESPGIGSEHRVVPEMFEGRFGTLMRLGSIVLITVLLLFTALGGVAFFDHLSRSFGG